MRTRGHSLSTLAWQVSICAIVLSVWQWGFQFHARFPWLVPDLLDNIEAAALAIDDGPRPNPGPWCDRCSYRAVCPASRELRYEPVEYYEDDED